MKAIKMIMILSVFTLSLFLGTTHIQGLTYGGMAEYVIDGDKAVITGFSGDPKVLVLPSEIDGKPVKEIRENAFFRCESLKEVTIPESVSHIGHHAFYCCENLESAVVHASVLNLEEGIFYGCSSLSYVSLPNSVILISPYVFFGCESLESMDFPLSLSSIGDYAFYESGISAGDIPQSVSVLGENTFSAPQTTEASPASAEPFTKSHVSHMMLDILCPVILFGTYLKHIYKKNNAESAKRIQR